MRFKYRFLIIPFLIIFSIFTCRKERSSPVEQEDAIAKPEIEQQDSPINFEVLEKMVAQSEQINVEVFFAISVLHRRYANQYLEHTEILSEEDKKVFYEKKKKEFFKTIKYTNAQYDQFFSENLEAINSYITQHPEIMEYLTTIN